VKRLSPLVALAACSLAVAAPRWLPEKKDPARARITAYRIAPGRHRDFLKWMAAQDEVAKEAGLPAVQLYAHLDGDSWDYLGIGPATTPEQDKKTDEVASRKGLKIGLPAWLEFREIVASHTDTFAAGPVGAAELLAQASK